MGKHGCSRASLKSLLNSNMHEKQSSGLCDPRGALGLTALEQSNKGLRLTFERGKRGLESLGNHRMVRPFPHRCRPQTHGLIVASKDKFSAPPPSKVAASVYILAPMFTVFHFRDLYLRKAHSDTWGKGASLCKVKHDFPFALILHMDFFKKLVFLILILKNCLINRNSAEIQSST